MAAFYELEDAIAKKDQRSKSFRLIELSDYIVRLNRRENSQLELRLNQLKRQETSFRRAHEREIHRKRMQLDHIYDTFSDPPTQAISNFAPSTNLPFQSVKLQRNQSAPPNSRRTPIEAKLQTRPNTTSNAIRRDKRAMSAFQEMALKPPCRTLGNLLILLDCEKKRLLKE